MTMERTLRVDADRLRAFAAALYEQAGLPAGDAQLVADSLVQADLWGHQSHGVLRLDWYRQRVLAGTMRAVTQPELVSDGGAIAVIDGRDGVGQVLAKRALEEAIARAKRHGLGAVAVRNSNHFGTAMYWTRLAASAGCIGFLSTNASPSMAPWGARAKRIGNNPWSIAAPAGRHAPMILDIANTAVARGKVYLARQRGEPIPQGWALDAEGRPTTDPRAAIEGMILPMAGHKGYAITVMMDVLFEARMERYVEELKSAPRAPGCEEIFYPGEIEARNDARNRAQGLELPEATVAWLHALARACGIDAGF